MLNCKIRCNKEGKDFKLGEAFEVIDGKIQFSEDNCSAGTYESIEKINAAIKNLKAYMYYAIDDMPIDVGNAITEALTCLREKLQRLENPPLATVITSEDDFYHFCSKCYGEVYKKDSYCHTCGSKLKWGKNDVKL